MAWCRDASYILRDWALSGNIVAAALQQLYLIWSHQIEQGREKLVYGRGSPEMKFVSEEAKEDKQKEFAGALPTTIYLLMKVMVHSHLELEYRLSGLP